MSDTGEVESASAATSPRGVIHRVSRVPTPAIFATSVVVAVVFLWRQGSLGEVGDALRKADIPTIIAGISLYLIGLVLLCERWHLLVRMVNGVSSRVQAAEAFLTSVVINYAAPVGLAVPTRAALTKRSLGLDAAATGAIALWEVAVDVIVLAIFSALWLALGGWNLSILPQTTRAEQFLATTFMVLGSIVVVLIGVAAARRTPKLWRKTASIALTILRFPMQRPLEASIVFGLTVIYWAMQGAVMWLLLRALDTSPSVTLVVGLTSLPILVGMLSPVPGGAGVREALMLGVARVHDTDSAAVLLAALTYRIALFASIPVLYAGVRLWLATHRTGSDQPGLQELSETQEMV